MTSRTPRTTPHIHDNRDNGAMSKLLISENEIGGYDSSKDALGALGAALKSCNVTELEISKVISKQRTSQFLLAT